MAKGQLITGFMLGGTRIQTTLDQEQRTVLDKLIIGTEKERAEIAKELLIAQIEDEGYSTKTEAHTLKSFEKMKGLGNTKATKARTLILIRLSRLGEFLDGQQT